MFLLRRAVRLLAVVASLALLFAGNRGVLADGMYGLSGPVPPDSALAKSSAAHGFDLSSLDPTCPACQDFAQFATGGWKKNNPIPADRSNWARFLVLLQDNQKTVRGILEDAERAHAAAGTNEQKIGDFYRSCTNMDARNAAGIAPLKPQLDRIAAMSAADLPAVLGDLHDQGVDVFFGAGGVTDTKNSDATIVGIGQGGIGLGNRDFYLKTDAKSQTIRDAYVEYITKDLTLAGTDAATARAQAGRMLALETAIAKLSRDNVALRDPALNYHKTDLAGVRAAAPAFDWARYFSARSIPAASNPINLSNAEYTKGVADLMAATPLDDVRAYLRFHLISNYDGDLSQPFVDAAFAFNAAFSGATQQRPLDQRCTVATDNYLGEALGAAYVAKAFSPEAKQRAQTMIANLRGELRDDIAGLDWMSDATRKEALTKLDAFTVKVGYPDSWRDYSTYAVTGGPYVVNTMAGNRFATRFNGERIGKPRDRTLWGMTPPTVNAYYNPTNNEIVFPAGVLQPPFFSPSNDDAINYGGMGAVIGHEMTHGFDNNGRKFDARGNNRDWWTAADATAFEQRASCVENEFSSFKVGDLNINGKFVLGEAIADLGGITIAYKAFKKSQIGKPQQVIDGFTPDQRFFLGYAQWFTRDFRDAEARRRITLDPHPMDYYRINGTVANLPEFATAFFCKMNDPMVRPAAQRCKIW
ncbi:MAG TPA: M13 family metallopeptidase [Candidatus Elarobacter sp.]|nr:M13 family metallopeptidase [Candidatus Elarobacter sp.]